MNGYLSSNLYIGTGRLVSETTLTLLLKPLHFDFSPNKVNVLANPMGLYVFKSNHNFIWMFTYTQPSLVWKILRRNVPRKYLSGVRTMPLVTVVQQVFGKFG